MTTTAGLTDDEATILLCFADIYDDGGIDGLSAYLAHCKIKMAPGMTAGDAILAHYRNPLGYDIDRAAMDLRMWPPVASHILELQTVEAERRTAEEGRFDRRKRRAMNGHAQTGHPI
jgi:hypothetical protein